MISEARQREIYDLADELCKMYRSKFGDVHFPTIAQHNGIAVAYAKTTGLDALAGKFPDGSYIILLSLRYIQEGVRPTTPEPLAAFHELGHIALGHLETGVEALGMSSRKAAAIRSRIREFEADKFAERVLENGARIWTKPLEIQVFD